MRSFTVHALTRNLDPDGNNLVVTLEYRTHWDGTGLYNSAGTCLRPREEFKVTDRVSLVKELNATLDPEDSILRFYLTRVGAEHRASDYRAEREKLISSIPALQFPRGGC